MEKEFQVHFGKKSEEEREGVKVQWKSMYPIGSWE